MEDRAAGDAHRPTRWRAAPRGTWGARRTTIIIRVCLDLDGYREVLQASVTRKHATSGVGAALTTLDAHEHDICNRVAARLSGVLQSRPGSIESGRASLFAIERAFDEGIVAAHVGTRINAELDMARVLHHIGALARQTYENKALSLGCIIDPTNTAQHGELMFPDHLVRGKKYRALTDGFRSAYVVSTHGRIVALRDLTTSRRVALSGPHYFPEWAEAMARMCTGDRWGIALTHVGDVLLFEQQSLRFSYRFGRWQYWNHTHLIGLLKNLARVQSAEPRAIGALVTSIYRAAIDVSFRRTGALFVVLKNRNSLHDIVRRGDAIGDPGRKPQDAVLDGTLSRFVKLPRIVAAEISGLDGAVVLANSGEILAYGAVLRPRRTGRIRGSEGSRTKAAVGASNYGIAVKVSTDGDVTVYVKGREFLRV